MKETTKSASVDKPWKAMTASQRAVFVLKVCVMVCTGGFVFGNILTE